jgi:hypothetical protein
VSEEIIRRLRESAHAYQPDHARMLARVERGLARPPVRHRTGSLTRSGRRTVLAAVATACLLATGGFAVADIVRGPSRPTTVITSSGSPTATPRPTPSASAPSPVSSPTTGSGSRPTPPAATQAQDGPLWSGGSLDPHSNLFWSQSDLVLRTTQPLTSLTVELRIAQTGGVRSTGAWSTMPPGDFTLTVRESGNGLVYRWVLKPGLTIPTGQFEFAAQDNHAPGRRDAGGDSYRVDAQTSSGPLAVWGGFAAPR